MNKRLLQLFIVSLLLVTTIIVAPMFHVAGSSRSEVMELRDRNSKTYDLGDNKYAIDVVIGSVHYQDEFGSWQEINNQWFAAQAPWDWEMIKDEYHTKVLEDFTAGQVLLFESQGEYIAFQPMALEWTNALDQVDQISMPQNVVAVVSNEPVELLPGMVGSISRISWHDGYGSGRHFEWENTPGRLNKRLVLDSSPPVPPQYIIDGGNPVLRLNFIFDPSPDLDIYVDNALWDRRSRQQSFNTIEFRRADEVLWGFMPATYWDSSEVNRGIGFTELRKVGSSLYVSVQVPYEWLQTATYPVYIDPTLDLQVSTGADDAYEKGDGTFYATDEYIYASSRTDPSSQYYNCAGFRFQTVSIPYSSTINVAYMEVWVSSTSYDSPNVKIYCNDVDDAVNFSDDAHIINRTRTTAYESWIANDIGAGTYKQTPTLVAPTQEVVNRGGWASNNDIVYLFIGNNDVNFKVLGAHAYEEPIGHVPKLHIEYTEGGCSPSISLNTYSWSAGPIEENSNYSSGLTHFTITNNSGGAVTITIGGTDMTGGGYTWTLSDTATPGDMICGLKAGLSGGDYTIIVKKTTPYNTLVSGLADSGTQDFGLRLYTPTDFDDGYEKSGTITLTATCD